MVSAKSNSFLEIDSLRAGYGSQTILDDFSLDIHEGHLACLLGPSGCGKSTVLRSIAGFCDVSAGRITLGNNTLYSRDVNVLPEQRGVGMVFQDHVLFPHLNVAKNIELGISHSARSIRSKRVSQLLELVGLPDLKDAYPHELSGGQAQRVSIARALAPKPRLLLLDEPFSNMDAELRESLGEEIKALLRQLNITALMVTHHQQDAFSLADQMGIMSAGKLLQWGCPKELYEKPKTPFVARFIGRASFIRGIYDGVGFANTCLGKLEVQRAGNVAGQSTGKRTRHPQLNDVVDVLVRPEDITISKDGNCSAKVVYINDFGDHKIVTLMLDSSEQLQCKSIRDDTIEVDQRVSIYVSDSSFTCFNEIP